MKRCRLPGLLWRCTRAPEHEGPCAAVRPWSKRWIKRVYVG